MNDSKFLLVGIFCLIAGLIQLGFRKPIVALTLRWRDRVWRALGTKQPLSAIETFLAGPGSILIGWFMIAAGVLVCSLALVDGL